MSAAEPARPLVVFSHPNHELAIWGLISRRRPHLLFLTDGGGASRVEATRRGMEKLGLLGRATFLGYPEDELYRVLLDRDRVVLGDLVRAVAGAVEATGSTQLFCDAVEFYNPVHDLTLPLVLGALGPSSDVPVFEIPLIHQRRARTESYRVQRVAGDGGPGTHRLELAPAELVAKIEAREEIYRDLRDQLGPVICDLPAEHLAAEEWREAGSPLRQPAADEVLRYERRGELLRERGSVERVIYRRAHYLPVAEWLLRESRPHASPAS